MWPLQICIGSTIRISCERWLYFLRPLKQDTDKVELLNWLHSKCIFMLFVDKYSHLTTNHAILTSSADAILKAMNNTIFGEILGWSEFLCFVENFLTWETHWLTDWTIYYDLVPSRHHAMAWDTFPAPRDFGMTMSWISHEFLMNFWIGHGLCRFGPCKSANTIFLFGSPWAVVLIRINILIVLVLSYNTAGGQYPLFC